MAWPDTLEKLTTDIPHEELTVLRFAMEHDLGEWKDVSEFAGYLQATYNFNNMEYEVYEEMELLTSIHKKDKTCNQNLCAMESK